MNASKLDERPRPFGGVARLTEIRRQAHDWQHRASKNLAAGKVHDAMEIYRVHKAVHEATSRESAIDALADDYLKDLAHNPDGSRLAFAHRRKDVHDINQAIKAAKRLRGESQVEHLLETEQGPRAFGVGDRILFTRNDRDVGVRNGMLGTVTQIDGNQVIVELDTNDVGVQRTVTLGPTGFTSFDHGFAVSIHRAQGATVDRSFILSSKMMDNHLSYVALTRHKEAARLYAAPDLHRYPDLKFDKPISNSKGHSQGPARSR